MKTELKNSYWFVSVAIFVKEDGRNYAFFSGHIALSSATYDNGFAAQVPVRVKESFEACLDDPGVFLTSHLLMMKSSTSAPS